jgi:hypothetical protein
MLPCVRVSACASASAVITRALSSAVSGEQESPHSRGAFLWLRGKDSNLDYLIQSYLPGMTVSVNGSCEVRDLQGKQAAADDARDVA